METISVLALITWIFLCRKLWLSDILFVSWQSLSNVSKKCKICDEVGGGGAGINFYRL